MVRTAMGIVGQKLRIAGGGRPLPRILTWTLNFRCNARCGMCDSWKKPAGDEMDTDQALSVVARLPPSISAVRLTGGEPFLRDDLGTLVRALENRLRLDLVHLTTNGFLPDVVGAFLDSRARVSSVPLHLLVSVDGMDELHNEIRGRPFAFRKAMETLELVAANRRRWNVELAVNQTIVDTRGIAQYGLLRERLRSMDVPHHVVVAYAESATYSIAESADFSPSSAGAYRTATPIPRDLLESFLDEVDADTRDLPLGNRISKRYYLEGIRNRVLDGRGSPNPPCAALGGHMRIYPNGDVPVCQFNSRAVGNLLRTDFESLWNSEAALTWHAWVRRCAGCWAECEVLPSAILGGDLARHAARRIVRRAVAA